MKIIDTRGQLCPAPLMTTKRALKAAPEGGEFTIITDNDTARHNLVSFLAEMGLVANCTEQGGEFRIAFSTNGQITQTPDVADFCQSAPSTSGYVVAIKGETMGSGSDELGAILMRACINSLTELDSLPHSIVLYNSGVKLAIRETDTARSLETLAERGVQIIVCGACVDYFGIKAELTGCTQISNMLKINTILSQASHIIYP